VLSGCEQDKKGLGLYIENWLEGYGSEIIVDLVKIMPWKMGEVLGSQIRKVFVPSINLEQM
jgi:hypothetical protein